MAYMYIVKCRDGMLYVGSTRDLDKRLWEHNAGLGATFTARRVPVELVYCEAYDRIDEAFRREKQVQNWSRAKREALIAGDYELLHRLARRRGRSDRSG